MNDKSSNEWLEWLKTAGVAYMPPGLNTREMIGRVLTETVKHTNKVKEWWIENRGIGSARVIVSASAAFVLAFQQWVDWHKPADEAWEVEQAPSFAAMLARDPHAQALIASRTVPIVTATMRLTQDEAHNIPETRFETVTVQRDGVEIGQLSIQVHKGESANSVMARARVMTVDYAQGHESEIHSASAVPQWGSGGNSFRFDSGDSFHREYAGQPVSQGGAFRFAGRDYPYKSLTSENGARTFICEMESERADQLYNGTTVGMLVVDERSVGVVEMLNAKRSASPTRRKVDVVTLTFGTPRPKQAATADAPPVPQWTDVSAWDVPSAAVGAFNFVVPSKDAMAAAGQNFGNRYAFREDVETKGKGLYVGVDVAIERERAYVERVVNEHLGKGGAHAVGPIHQMFANEIAKKLQPLYENNDRIAREFCERQAGVVAPRKTASDPVLVAKLAAEMSAAILGPTHALDRVVDLESANVPAKCDPTRWRNVVRAIAADFTEKASHGERDAQWWATVAKITTEHATYARPLIERYEAFRREGYSRDHSYQRAIGKPGDETIAAMRAYAAYVSAK